MADIWKEGCQAVRLSATKGKQTACPKNHCLFFKYFVLFCVHHYLSIMIDETPPKKHLNLQKLNATKKLGINN